MDVPICPVCKEPTKREVVSQTETLLYIPLVYDESGCVVDSPIKNKVKTTWRCLKCGKRF